ncbi:uncharacterized protein [Epargyreus clarus]|uniref:uncharacterized protein isoform X2 n=1 Tax=Epargyreus clarus TaxID=520877 RepID=UPI003C30E88A
MLQLHQLVHATVLLLLVWIDTPTVEAISGSSVCPIGFKEISHDGSTICYRKKGPEIFSDLYKDCARNIFSLHLYNQLDIDKSNAVWSEYKNAYPGGPFLNRRFIDDFGSEMSSSYKVQLQNHSLEVEEDLCVVVDPVRSYLAVRCDEKHYRYCFVPPSTFKGDRYELTKTHCEDLKDSLVFSSPVPTCLTVLSGTSTMPASTGIVPVRARWNQAQDMCGRKGGSSLLNRGWRYANHPRLHSSYENKIYPLGMITTSDHSLLRYDALSDHAEIPKSEWNFKDPIDDAKTMNALLGALSGEQWELVNSSYTFFDVICERTIKSQNVSILLYVDVENKLVLNVSENIDSKDLYCFSDSDFDFPNRVKTRKGPNNNFILTPKSENGYYWCIYKDPITYKSVESDKILFIREKESLANVYAVKIRSIRAYDDGNFDTRRHKWRKHLKEYIYYSKKYLIYHDKMPIGNNTEEILKSFKSAKGIDDAKDEDVVRDTHLKRKYLDNRTVLFHVDLYPGMEAVAPGKWDSIEVIYMRPVYYCKQFLTDHSEIVPETAMGGSVTLDCVTYKCIGDFNEGVQWSMWAREGCLRSSTEKLPEDQLQQVLDDLDRLVNDTVSMENITNVFDQVNDILEERELEIPGRLLHLLDQLGSAVELHGAHTAAAVASNVALLVGDAAPDAPIQGIRIANRDNDEFTNDTFEIMREPANSTTLEADKNEAVVQLPASVAHSARRVSFVVFRNDRAFRRDSLRVNSRVFSVNVQNLTQFADGEVIDIHISPMTTNIGRNESRACAFWQFDSDGGGEWSRAGCRLLRGRGGALDTCRCDHLTHFAEILVPRTAFPARHEAALELLSVLGCCLSALGLALVALTAALFRTWRRDFSNKIWLQLCASIAVMVTCFLVVVFARFDHYNVACMLVGIALHYSVLTSFCWMLVAAVVSYRRLVLVFTRDASHKLLRASAFAYGVPCAVVGILLAVAPHSYSGRFEEKTPSGSFCYPTGLGLWLAVYAPIAIMLLANWTLFGLIVRSVFASRSIQRHGDTNEALRCASVSCLLVFLFGLPWIFGLFAFNIGAAYLFTITTTFQGLILFLFFILGNKKTRDLWLNKLKIKQTRKVPVTSSTYTNRSTGARAPPAPAAPAGKPAAPRSLSSDDSKFS